MLSNALNQAIQGSLAFQPKRQGATLRTKQDFKLLTTKTMQCKRGVATFATLKIKLYERICLKMPILVIETKCIIH